MSRVASQAENVRAATREGGVVPVRRRRKGERGGWLGLIGMDYQDKSGLEKDVHAGERHRRERERQEQRGKGRGGRRRRGRRERIYRSLPPCVLRRVYLASVFLCIIFFLSSFLLTRSSVSSTI